MTRATALPLLPLLAGLTLLRPGRRQAAAWMMLAWVQAGRLRATAGDHAAAEAAFAKAVALAPDYQLARLSLGQELRRRDLDGALRELRRSLWLVPDDPGTLAGLSGIHIARGELARIEGIRQGEGE